MLMETRFMSNAIMLTDANFEQEVLKSDLPVLVDFWAEWCFPCKMIAPIIEELSAEFAGKLKIGKLDTDKNQSTAIKYGISGIPTLLLFKNGELVDRMVGLAPKYMIRDKLNYFLNTAETIKA